MKILSRLKTLVEYVPSASTILNLGGTGLIAIGLWLLPIDVSFRLILLGCLSIVLWRTLSD